MHTVIHELNRKKKDFFLVKDTHGKFFPCICFYFFFRAERHVFSGDRANRDAKVFFEFFDSTAEMCHSFCFFLVLFFWPSYESLSKIATKIATDVARCMCMCRIYYTGMHVGRQMAPHTKNQQRWTAVVRLPAPPPDSVQWLNSCTVVFDSKFLPVLFKPLTFNESNIASQVFAHRIGFVDYAHRLLPIPIEKLDSLSYKDFEKLEISFIAAVCIQNTLRSCREPRPFTLF